MKLTVGRVWVFIAMALFSGALVFGQSEAPAAQNRPVSVRGKISAADKQSLRVKTAAGEVMVKVPDKVAMQGVDAAKLSDISAGDYVGTATVKQSDGTLKALEVTIFPASARGTREGQRPYDLKPGSTMTNADVEKIQPSAVEKVQGQMLSLKYKGGEQKVFVPSGTPVVRFVPGDRSLLKPGTGVYIAATRDEHGMLMASRIVAGVDGVMPPL